MLKVLVKVQKVFEVRVPRDYPSLFGARGGGGAKLGLSGRFNL